MSAAACGVRVSGTGWVNGSRAGGMRGAFRRTLDARTAGAAWTEGGAFAYPVRHFGRMNAASRRACIACALALRDAGLAEAEGHPLAIGLVGGNPDGSFHENRAYFEDYVAAGRSLARGNLFVYTLPTSPLAEASIHCGLRGPVLYVGLPGARAPALLRMAADLLTGGEAARMLAVDDDGRAAVGFLLEPAGGDDAWSMDGVLKRIGGARTVGGVVRALARGHAKGSDACT